MSKYSSMTIDELKLEYYKIDKIKYPVEAIAIYDELSKRKEKLSQEELNFDDVQPLAKIEDRVHGRIKLKALAAILTLVSFIALKYIGIFLYTVICFAHRIIANNSWDHQRDQIESLVIEFTTENINTLMAVEFLAGGLAILLMTKLFASNLLKVPGDHGVGWVWSGYNYLWKAFIAGTSLGLIMLLFSEGNIYPTFINNKSTTKGFELLWMIISILLFAPIIEEYLFRGILYAGFTNSWNKDLSSILITILFVLMHLPAADYKIIPLFSILVLALITLIFRRKSGVLAPSIMVHFSYNLIIVCFVLIKIS